MHIDISDADEQNTDGLSVDRADFDDAVIGETSIQEVFLNASTILRYLIGNDDQLETLVMCNPANQVFVTTDQDLYDALASMQSYETLNKNKLVKLLESVRVRPVDKRVILTHEKLEDIRKEALRGSAPDSSDKGHQD